MAKIKPVKVPITAVNQFTKPFRDFNKALGRANAPLKKLQGQFNATSLKMSAMTKKMRKFSDSSKKMGQSMSQKVTLPFALLGGYIVKTAGDFQLATNKLENLTVAGGATEKQVKALKDQAKDLGSQTQFSASQAAEAMNFLAMSGMNANDILGATPKVLDLAAASGLELAESADIVSNVMSAYGKSAEELDDVNDVLVTGFQSSNTNLQMLGESMKKVAPIAASMKIPIEDTTKAIGLLGNAGIQGEDAGTALRNTLLSLVNPTKQAKQTLSNLKIKKTDIIDEKGNVRSLTGVVKAMLSAGASAKDMSVIFGKRTGPALLAAVNQGKAGLDQLDERMNKRAGSTKKSAEVMQRGWSGAFASMKSAFEAFQIAVAESGFLEMVTKWAKKIGDFFRWLSKTNPAILKMGTVVALLAAAIGPLIVAFGFIAGAVANIMAIWPFLVTAFTVMKAVVIPGLIASFGSLMLTILPFVAALGAVWFAWNRINNAINEKENQKKRIAEMEARTDKIVGLSKAYVKLRDARVLAEKSGDKSKTSDLLKKENEALKKLQDARKKKTVVKNEDPIGAFAGLVEANKSASLSPGKLNKIRNNSNNVSTTNTEKASVTVDFKNLPKGTNVKQESTGKMGLSVNQGFNSLGLQ